MTGSAAEANRFAREYGAAHTPSPAERDGPAPGAVVTTAPGKAASRGAGSSGRAVKPRLPPAAFGRVRTVNSISCMPRHGPEAPVHSASGSQIPSVLLM
ncbi:hypothetical protein ACFXKC_43495 [Streptomyces sp. NPDC059340]|uniref:hypothetical protein n=1 Tax=Streptomyces sp. NPDC059340 TaxID=3346806 RepID=UPI0036874EC6